MVKIFAMMEKIITFVVKIITKYLLFSIWRRQIYQLFAK